MKKLFAKLLLFLPIFLAVGVVNYTVDPSQLFGNGKVERQMVEIMLSGENVGNIINYDHRLLQKIYFENLAEPADIVVLGSSRSMLLSASLFPGHSLYNAAVAGASLQDYLAIYEIMRVTGHEPQVLILDVAPWIFNHNNQQTRWKSLSAEYLGGLQRLGYQPNLQTRLQSYDLEKYSALFSLPYLQDSLRWFSRQAEFYATQEAYTGDTMKLSDGSRVYGAAEEARNAAQLDQLVQQAAQRPYSLDKFTELDAQSIEIFERFISSMEEEGVRVILLLVPYQPAYYEALMEDERYQIVVDVEHYLHRVAADNSIPLWGSYDPSQLGCAAEEYYDALHPRRICIERISLSLDQ